MNSKILKQFTEEFKAEEPWPDDAVLYQPCDALKILLAENASCLAVRTFLKMCKLPYKVETRANAEFMSPGGKMTKLPILKAGAFVVSEFEQIVNLLEHKGHSLSSFLDEDQKNDMRAHMLLVENIFTHAELYISFLDEDVYESITSQRYSFGYPWPLNHYLNWRKRSQVVRQLKVFGWYDLTMDEVVEKVKKCCEALSNKLEDRLYFFEKPTEFDAITFGHLFTILTTKLPNEALAGQVRQFSSLTRFCDNIDTQYFKKKSKE